MLTRDQAIAAVRNASSWRDASTIRNDVAMEAMKGMRPEADADAVRDAYFDRWNHELAKVDRKIETPTTGYWGD
jgi:hypothetical protein